jgi:hypothetical protein
VACYVLFASKGVTVMAKPKTVFEKVPLKVAKKIAKAEKPETVRENKRSKER